MLRILEVKENDRRQASASESLFVEGVSKVSNFRFIPIFSGFAED